MAVSANKQQWLKDELERLKKLADEQTHHYVSAWKLLHEGLSRVYVWWSEANKEKGLLEKLYDEYAIQYKRETIHEVNFSPLLRFLWGMDGSVNSATIDQWNRALNSMHVAVLNDKEFYKTNTLSKLVSFIAASKGIKGLAGYTPEPIDKAAETKSVRKAKADALAEGKRQAAHLKQGQAYFASDAAALAKFQVPHTLATGNTGIGLALIRKTSSGYSLLGTIDDEDMLRQAIITSYKRTTDTVPITVRLLTEVIATQALPYSIRTMSAALAEPSKHKTSEGKPTKQLKRLLYRAGDKTFVLSTNRSECGVVTIAEPKVTIINSKVDVALAVGDRTYIENNVIHSGDINLYSADAADLIPTVKDEVASHRLQLENTASKRFRYVRFYPLTAFQSAASQSQAKLRSDHKFKPTYVAKLDRRWLDELNGKFLSRWVAGFGKQIKRAENTVMRLSLGKAGLTIHYTYKARDFKEFQQIPFAASIATKPINVMVLSKDIIPVLNALVQMEINGAVTLQADEDMVQFVFKTDCAGYCIAVPCCNEKLKRIGNNFAAYGAVNGN